MAPRMRVLLDLSIACRGYCGIAQDVRLLYKTLSLCPEVEVTGLIYRPRKFAQPYRPLSPRAGEEDRAADQAEYLRRLAGDEDLGGGGSVRRRLNWLRVLGDTLLWGRARVAPLETGRFSSTLWDQMFQQTLPPEDQQLVADGRFLISNLSDGMIFARALSGRRPMALDTRGFDFLIVQGPRPFRVSPGTRHITRYHDMIPLLEPDTMKNPLVMQWHHRAIRQSQESVFVCNSDATREDLVSVYPECGPRAVTIPYTRSDVYYHEQAPAAVSEILCLRVSPASGGKLCEPPEELPRYLMCVSTLEPRKNFLGLMQAFNQVKRLASVRRQVGRLKLLIVGSPGWKETPILAAMRQLVRRGDLIHLEKLAAEELRLLYSHAEAVVFPSQAEGFGFPPLEAMQCGTPVIASDLPAHRWVLGDAAIYCNPYSVASIAEAIRRLIDPRDALRAELVRRGAERAERFTIERCTRHWRELFERLKSDPSPGAASPLVLSPSGASFRQAA